MVSYIVEHKWYILLISEITAWTFTFIMAYARYWLQSKILFKLATVVAVFTGWIVHLMLPVIEAIHLGDLSAVLQSKETLSFAAFIVVLLLVGGFVGKKYGKKIDVFFMNLAKKKAS